MRKGRTASVRMTPEARVLRQMRESRNLTMRQAGTLVGRSDLYISQIENGRVDSPTGARLERLLLAYGAGSTPRAFMSGSDRFANGPRQRTNSTTSSNA